MKYPFAVIQQDRDGSIPRTAIGDSYVWSAVAIEIADGQRIRAFANRKWRSRRSRKAALTIARQDGDIAVLVVDRNQVQHGVPIDIRRGEAVSVGMFPILGPEGRARCGSKIAATVAQQNDNVIKVVVDQSQVRVSVAIEIGQ